MSVRHKGVQKCEMQEGLFMQTISQHSQLKDEVTQCATDQNHAFKNQDNNKARYYKYHLATCTYPPAA